MARSVRELLEAKHGARFTAFVNRAASSVGIAAAQVLRQDPSRIGFLIVNLSLNNVYLRPRDDPTASLGIRLDAGGGTLGMNWEEDGEVVAWEWRAIADGAASPVFVLETIITSER